MLFADGVITEADVKAFAEIVGIVIVVGVGIGAGFLVRYQLKELKTKHDTLARSHYKIRDTVLRHQILLGDWARQHRGDDEEEDTELGYEIE